MWVCCEWGKTFCKTVGGVLRLLLLSVRWTVLRGCYCADCGNRNGYMVCVEICAGWGVSTGVGMG